MSKTLMIYIIAILIAFSSVTTITMQPIDISAQTQPAAPTQSPLQTQQQASQQPLAISPSCGQVITQNVLLTSNLNCADRDGTIQGFQAGILMTGSQNVELSNIISKNNQMGAFSTGASIVNAHLSIFMNNEIGFAGHSTQQATIQDNILFQNTLAGITLVNSDNGLLTLNSITESGNGLYVDNQSTNNNINFNNVLLNTVDINNANGLPVNTNTNTFDQNNCMTANPSGICIGK